MVLAASASADVPRTVKLEYERQEGAASCPEEAAIRTGVAARLGYEPFREQASDRLRTSIRQVGRLLEARIELVDAHGTAKAERRLVSRQHDCLELASSVELAIAIAIDPVLAPRRPMDEAATASAAADQPADATATDASPAGGRAVAPATAASARSSIRKRIDVGLLGGIGSAPSANLGLRAGVALEGDLASLGLEARADLPASTALRVGEASSSLLLASVVPCAHVGVAAGCFLLTAGAQRVAGEGLVDSRRATLPYVGLGLRLGLGLPVWARTFLTAHADMTAPLTLARLKVDESVVWRSPTIALALGIGLAFRFP
jgi:hypothetical protein